MLLRRLVSAWLRLILGVVEWFHARTVGPIVDWLDESVLAASEESVKLFVRECFTSAKRLINGFCAHLLGMFDAQYRESLKLTWQQKEAWHSWWREERTSTLNAVLAAQAAPDAADAAVADVCGGPVSRGSSLLRQRRSVAFSTRPDSTITNTNSSSGSGSGSSAGPLQRCLSRKGSAGRLPAQHIRWESDTAAQQQHDNTLPHRSSTGGSNGGCGSNGSGGGWGRQPSAFASAGGAAAAAASVPADSSSSSSWLARAVWWALVGLQGRAKTPPLVTAAATGHSTNPLETLPSLPSMSSLVSLPSLSALRPWGSGAAAAAPEPLQQQQQQQQGAAAATAAAAGQPEPYHHCSSRLGWGRGDHFQQQQQQQQQSLLRRLCSSIAARVRRCVALACMPLLAPLLPGLWLLSWLWGRTQARSAAAAAAAAAGGGCSGLRAASVSQPPHLRSSAADGGGSSSGSPRVGWGLRRRSSSSGASAGPFAAVQQQQQQQEVRRAPRQQRSSGQQGAAAAAAAAAPRRSIVFEEPSLLSAQEPTRRRGLLEELSVTTELIITATFDTLRWIVRALTLTRRHQPAAAAAAARQRRLAAAAAAAAAEAADAHLTPGSNGSSRGGVGRRGSSSNGSGSRSRPGSPAAGRPSPFASPRTAGAAAAAAAAAAERGDVGEDEPEGGHGFGAVFRAMSPGIDLGEEPGTQACLQQQQQQQYRSSSGGMLSPQSTVESYYSGLSGSSSSSGSESDSGDDELWGVGGSRAGGAAAPSLLRSKSEGGDLAGFRKGTNPGATALPRLTLRRVRSVSRWNHHNDAAAAAAAAGSGGGSSGSGGWRGGSSGGAAAAAVEDWDGGSELTAAAQCIMSAGYPLEVHTVTTADGVVLQMERIPRPGCSRVAFFLHGILDTSLTWVSSGVTGSQAFAAWDQGFDVWLGASRSNAPRIARDPVKQGLRYFSFSLNELGIHDIPAQLDHLHTVKMRELAGSSLRSQGGGAAPHPTPAAAAAAAGPSAAAAAAGLRVDVHGLDPWLMSEQQGAPYHAADSEAVFGRAAALSPSSAVSLQQQQPQGAVSWQQQQQEQHESGWHSPRSTMKRTQSDPTINLLPQRGRGAAAAAAAAAAGAPPGGQEQAGQGKQRGGVLRAAGRLLRGAVRPGKQQQQQQQADQPYPQQQQQQWQTAAAMAAVVSAAAASAAATAAVAAATAAGSGSLPSSTQQQQQQQQSAAALRPPQQSPKSHNISVEVHEPSTPDVIESPRRPEDGSSGGGCDGSAAAAAATAAAAAVAAAAAAALGDEDTISPFTCPGEADAAIAAAEATAAAAADGGGSNGGSSGGWHSPCEYAVPRMRSTGSVGTAVEGRQQRGRQQQQQQQVASPRSCGTSSSAPGSNHHQEQQQEQHTHTTTSSTTSGSQSTPGAAPRQAAAGAAATAATEPYDLRVVAHSLGGMSMLMFCVMRAAAGLPHRVRRLVLLSPAGFHDVIPWAWWPFIYILPYWHRLLALLLGRDRAYHPALLPTYAARGFFFSGLLELARLPAMADFLRAAMSAFFGGDASQWERALLMPHYSAAGMPACSLHQALHFIQIIHSGRFQLFDYGSPAENMARYGVPRPPDVASQYWRLANLPVELMAGSNDGIIPPVNVRRHYRAMQAAGMKVTYREFAYGHMDFTSLAAFSIKDEMRYHVMRALNANS